MFSKSLLLYPDHQHSGGTDKNSRMDKWTYGMWRHFPMHLNLNEISITWLRFCCCYVVVFCCCCFYCCFLMFCNTIWIQLFFFSPWLNISDIFQEFEIMKNTKYEWWLLNSELMLYNTTENSIMFLYCPIKISLLFNLLCLVLKQNKNHLHMPTFFLNHQNQNSTWIIIITTDISMVHDP